MEMEEDSRLLFKAALAGNVSALHQLIHENPLILAHSALVSPHENPLHIAIKAGHLGFAQEMLGLRPESVNEVDRYGFRPLDIASALGYIEIVKVIVMMSNGNEICGMKGRDGRAAIHYAAINGKVEIIDELLSSWGDCIKDVTALGETALHLSVKFYKFEAFRKLIKWLEILGLEELVNSGDEDGNTVLHLAVSRKQHEYVQLLLGNSTSTASKLELNAKNSKGLTVMDIMDILVLENPSDAHLQKILQRAGPIRAGLDANSASSTPSASQLHHVAVLNVANNQEPPLMEGEKKDWIKHFRFQQERDSPSDTRNVLLVVATLIATVTFQAGVSPPSGYTRGKNHIDSDEKSNTTSNAFSPSPYSSTPQFFPTTVVMGPLFAFLGNLFAASEFFLLGNSLGLAASISLIIYLTDEFPFQRELHISIYSLLFAYGLSVKDIYTMSNPKAYIIMVFAFLFPFSLRWLPRWAKRIWRRCNDKRDQPL